jgi:hypothetical protein
MRRLVFGVVAVCSFTSASWATEYADPLALDGSTLQKLCASSSETNRAMCRGYVLGVSGGVRYAQPVTTQCFHTGLTSLYDKEAIDIVSVYLAETRQGLQSDAALSTISALTRGHSCPN